MDIKHIALYHIVKTFHLLKDKSLQPNKEQIINPPPANGKLNFLSTDFLKTSKSFIKKNPGVFPWL